MHAIPKFRGALLALVVLLAIPTVTIAQNDSDSAIVSVTVIEAPQLLTISATYTQEESNVTTDGGTAYGTMTVAVQDNRIGNDGWSVLASIGPFIKDAVALTGPEFSIMLNGTAPAGITTTPMGTMILPNLLLMQAAAKASVSVTWDTYVSFPAGVEPGTYNATLTFDLSGEDPF